MKLSRIFGTALLAVALTGNAIAAQNTAVTPRSSHQTSGDNQRTLSFKIAKEVIDGKVKYYDEQTHKITYFHDGAYDQQALAEINRLLEDHEKNSEPDHGMD